MAYTEPRQIQNALNQPFAPEDLEWRVQTTSKDKTRGLAVPYVTNRAIQSRLDDVAGPENWHNEYKPWHSNGKKESQICGISIYFEGRGWITKWDGAEDTDVEPIKGGLSDSMKRAAVQWGVGRVLYNLDTVWVGIEQRGNSYVISDSERPKLDKAYAGMLAKLKLTPAAATGAQAQLTPTAPRGGEQPEQTPQTPRQSAPAKEAPTAQAEESLPQKPAEPQPPKAPPAQQPTQAKPPEAEYTVKSFVVQKGMSSVSTSLTLVDAEGKAIQAFARGELEDIYDGARLCSVKLAIKKQNNVVFYVLESYEVLPPVQRAA